MKTALLISTFALIAFGACAQSFKKAYFNSDWEKCDPSAAAYYSEYSFLPDGLFQVEDFHMNGSLQMKGTYAALEPKEVEHGYFVYYYPSGLKEVEGKYEDGKKTGRWVWYFENGRKRAEAEYVADELEGTKTTYHTNGRMKTQGFYEANVKESMHMAWNEQGNEIMRKTYRNGALNGQFREYHADGVTLKSQGEFEQGSGNLMGWHPNGVRCRDGQYSKGKESGLWSYWYDNKQLMKRGAFKNGKEEGVWKTYHTNGVLESEGLFAEGKKMGKWSSWHSNGNLASVGEYLNDEEQGKFKFFDINSHKESIVKFDEGRAAKRKQFEVVTL